MYPSLCVAMYDPHPLAFMVVAGRLVMQNAFSHNCLSSNCFVSFVTK